MPQDRDREICDLFSSDRTLTLLKRFYYHALEVLEERAGQDSPKLLRPYFSSAVAAAANRQRKWANIDGNNLISNGRLVSLGIDYFGYGNIPLELHERAVVKRVNRCVVQDGPENACIHCEIGGVMECEANNGEHTMVVTKTMTGGFKNCELQVITKNTGSKAASDHGKYIMDLPDNPLSPQERLTIAREVLSFYTEFCAAAYIDNFGASDFINHMRYRLYIEGARFYFGLKNAQPELTLSDSLRSFFNIMNMKICDDTSGNDCFTIRISDCPFSGLAPSYCLMLEMFIKGICLMANPECEVVHTGDPAARESCAYEIRPIPTPDRKWVESVDPVHCSNCGPR